jgi:hypothetical protein
MLHGDAQSPADAERDVAHEVGNHIGGRVVVTIAEHGADGAETVTAGDQARLDATSAHLAKSDRGGETVAQAVAVHRRGGITTLGDGLGGAPTALSSRSLQDVAAATHCEAPAARRRRALPGE